MKRKHQIQLAPSILTADFGALTSEIEAAEAGGADLIHLDVMDGSFVPNITFGPVVVEAVRRATSLPVDVHLMVQEPGRYVADYVNAGATNLTVHIEACLHLHRTIQQINDLGCGIGVALNPATSIDAAREILPFVDMVLLMSVNPGFGGQRFIETTTSKLRRMRDLCNEFNPTCALQVDGGINTTTIQDVIEAGANVLVVGSAVYNAKGTVARNLAKLKEAASMVD